LKLRIIILGGLLATGLTVSALTAAVASADPGVGPNAEFLCPAVGHAVTT
jgi:hypothetical protein